jgi:DNA mismatch repair protein MutS
MLAESLLAIPPGADLSAPPDFFHDLHLDQVVASVTAGWEDYDLTGYFYHLPREAGEILRRQQILRELDGGPLHPAIEAFGKEMAAMRHRLQDSSHLARYRYARPRRFLGAASAYCRAVQGLARALQQVGCQAPGLLAFRDYLGGYEAREDFQRLARETGGLEKQLAALQYGLLIRGGSITVRDEPGGEDLGAVIEAFFGKFRDSGSRAGPVGGPPWEGMNHVEEQIQQRVARLFPQVYGTLEAFCAAHPGFWDEAVVRFDRELHFFRAYLAFVDKLRACGLRFCLPRLTRRSEEISATDAFDLALAAQMARERTRTKIVPNSFYLQDPERVLVVTGANHGGKTTFARMVGQLHYLARLGLYVPAAEAKLFVCDRIFTLFEREENAASLRGKLESDLVRVRRVLDAASPDSLIIVNEIFSSTTLRDALLLSTRLMARIGELDSIVVWVTFLDELATFSRKTVSVVAMADPADPTVPTYRLGRHRAAGLAYALAVAAKHRVTPKEILTRLPA